MTDSLDVSLHGTQRVEIIERLVHVCRYSPGLVFLDGEPGKSPVNFLRHMADLLRDELDFALLGSEHIHIVQVCQALMAQWFVYRAGDDAQTDAQHIHHFLDVGAQGGRMALVVVERTVVLEDDAINFLIGLMARHSKLTVLFAGIVDSRPLLRRAQQAEVPVHRIELPDNLPDSRHGESVFSSERIRGELETQHTAFSLTNSGLQSQQLSKNANVSETILEKSAMPRRGADRSYDRVFASEDLFLDEGSEIGLAASRRGDVMAQRAHLERTQRAVDRAEKFEPTLGVSARLSDLRAWGEQTFAGLQRKRSGLPLLIVSVAALAALLLVSALYYPHDAGESRSVQSNASQSPVVITSTAPVPVISVPPASPVELGAVQTSLKEGAAVPVVPSTVTPAPSQQISQPQLVTVSAGAVPPVTPVETAPLVVAESQAKPTEGAKDAPKTAGRTKEAPVDATTAKQTKVKGKQGEHDEQPGKQWRANPNNFTVQLAAAYGEASVSALAAKLPKSQPHLIYRTQRDGKPWFVLVYGSFSSRAAAMAASKNDLTPVLKGGATPWVRKQGEVFVR